MKQLLFFILFVPSICFASDPVVVEVPKACTKIININLSQGGGDSIFNYVVVGCLNEATGQTFAITKSLMNGWGLLGLNRYAIPERIVIKKSEE